MNRSSLCLAALAGVLAAAGALGACSAANSGTGSGFGGNDSSNPSGGDTKAGGDTSTTNPASTGELNPITSGTGNSTGADCNGGPNDDMDGDGWTPAQGDCNDCDPNVNPGAIEVVADPSDPNAVAADENCNNMTDEPVAGCDTGLALDDVSPISGAKAIGLCQFASASNQRGPGWNYGIIDVAYTRANGAPLTMPKAQVGLQAKFGDNVSPIEGATMLAMSSGRARTPGQTDACNKESCTSHAGAGKPPNFPSKVPGCGGGPTTPINDDVAFQAHLRAPTNATGYKFRFRFYSFEFCEYVCTEYNDQFIALVTPPPMGSLDGNISFDSNHNPVSVNIGFFDVCNANSGEGWAANCFGGSCPSKPNPYCPSGQGDLAGTGFDGVWSGNWGGATSWLESQAPIGGGEEFTIRFAMWDAGDQALDSTTLLDGFEWIASGGTVKVGTGVSDAGPH